MAGSSEQLVQAQQEKIIINELFTNSVFTNSIEHESPGYLLGQLTQAQNEFTQYGESFNANSNKRCVIIISSFLLGFISTIILSVNTGMWGCMAGVFTTIFAIAYFIISHEKRHAHRFLTFFKKGKSIDRRIKEYKQRLLPIISSKEFQFKMLYQLQMLGEKIAHDTPGVNQGWIMERYNKLKLAFNNKDYDEAYSILQEFSENHELIHNKLLQKIDMITYDEELKEFVTKQKNIDQHLPFEHHLQQFKSLL